MHGSGLDDNFAPIFEVTEGADLSIKNLTFDAGGGNANGPYNRENQGGGKGIFIDVPFERTGVVSLDLTKVTVMGTGNHGVHVSDCTLGDDCGGEPDVDDAFDIDEARDGSVIGRVVNLDIEGDIEIL